MKAIAICFLALGLIGCGNEPAPSAKPIVKKVSTTQKFAVPVLMYHRICELTPKEAESPLVRDLTVSPKDFEEQVRYLAENGFTFLLAREVEEAVRTGAPLPEKAVAITMDDGYKDNFENAFPILCKYGASATIFLVTSTLNTPKHLTWNDVLEMKPRGVGYGSHTVHHFDLTTLSPTELEFELIESKRLIEQRIDSPITSLAYPAGHYNARVAVRAKEVGYLACWKKGGGPVEPQNDPYLLPRVRVSGRTTLEDFKRKVWSGVYVQKMRSSTRVAMRD